MSNDFVSKVLLIIMYLIIIILVPIFLDYLFRITVRRRRKSGIKYLAEKKSLELNKSLVIFNDPYHGVVVNLTDKTREEFTGYIIDIIDQMSDNSCVIIVSETLEYIDNTNELLVKTLEQINRVSGGNFYTVNIEKNSPRTLWDYRIKNIMDKSFYLPQNDIAWNTPNRLQLRIQNIYRYIFKILPYKFMDPPSKFTDSK